MRELSLHILDLVQNSIEAQASLVELEVIEDTLLNDLLIIRVKDNGRGMDEATARQVLDPFVTTRSTRKVGLGLPLIDMSTRRCGGYVKIFSNIGKGTTIEACYQHSHLDRPPLGNMVATVKSIIVANPAVDFYYKHCVNNKQFTLGTKEIIDVIGNIPLSHPEVLQWLEEYLSQNLLNLYGGGQSENN